MATHDEPESEDDDDLASAWGAALAEQVGDQAAGSAEQWAAMIGQQDAEQTSGGQERVLNQGEIDNLMGFDLEERALSDTGGVRAIINSAMVSYERLPMLEIVFDRLVRLLTSSLRNFTSDNIEVSLDTMSTMRFGDYLNSIPLPAMIGVFRAAEWDNSALMTVDSNLIYSIVDVLLGGRGSRAIRVEGRPYTTIESNLLRRMMELILENAATAFRPISPVHFELERLETNPRFAAIARPANAAILIKLRVDMEDRGGRVEILIPYATIEPIRELLLQGFMGEKLGRDPIWENHLASEIWQTRIPVEAVFAPLSVPLSRILDLEVGETIVLECGPDDPVTLRCGDIELTAGAIGRVGENVSVRIDRGIDKTKRGQGTREIRALQSA